MSKLKSLANGVGWGALSIATVIMFQLVIMAVMARLLEPADFGLVAIANVSLRFFSYFSQMGIAPALIQKESLSEGDIRAALALSLGVSSFFFILAVSMAGIIESFFDMKSLASVIQVLAINFIVLGFSSVSLGLLRRDRKFKALSLVEIISYIFGYGLIGLSSAYLGAGVWALVAAFLSQTLLSGILSYWVVRHPLSLKHTKKQRTHFIGYGGRYSVIGFLEFLTSNIDSLIVGKLLGATTAGYYNRSLLLANLPVEKPTKVLTQVLFPIMSTMSSEHEKQSISVQLSVLLVGSYAFAVGLGIHAAAPEIVSVLLGEKWHEVIPVLQILACAVGPIYTSNVMGVALDSMGKLQTKLRIKLFIFTLLSTMLFFAAPTGEVTNIALVVITAYWVKLLITGWVVVRLLCIPAIDVFKIIICIANVAISTGIMIMIAKHIMPAGYLIVFDLLLEIIFSAIGLVIGLWISLLIIGKQPAIHYLTNRVPIIAKLIRYNKYC